jgi:hypothetical protein
MFVRRNDRLKITKQELKELLCKKRGYYSERLVDTLYLDLEKSDIVLFYKPKLRIKLEKLESNIRSDISESPADWVRRIRQEILND